MAHTHTFRPSPSQLTTELHLILFPYFLFPFLSIAMTASVFMTVGIALERYIAVHYPINYSQAINRYQYRTIESM